MGADCILDSLIVICATGLYLLICGAVGLVIEKLPKMFPWFGRLMDKLGGEEDV